MHRKSTVFVPVLLALLALSPGRALAGHQCHQDIDDVWVDTLGHRCAAVASRAMTAEQACFGDVRCATARRRVMAPTLDISPRFTTGFDGPFTTGFNGPFTTAGGAAMLSPRSVGNRR
jgi:hypothetical protein